MWCCGQRDREEVQPALVAVEENLAKVGSKDLAAAGKDITTKVGPQHVKHLGRPPSETAHKGSAADPCRKPRIRPVDVSLSLAFYIMVGAWMSRSSDQWAESGIGLCLVRMALIAVLASVLQVAPFPSILCIGKALGERKRGWTPPVELHEIQPAPASEDEPKLPLDRPPCNAEADLAKEWRIVSSAIDAWELEKLNEFRAAVTALDKHQACQLEPHVRQATTLLRFLRAREHKIKEATDMIEWYLEWRCRADIDRRTRQWAEELKEGKTARAQLFLQYDYIKELGADRRGLPVYLIRFSVADIGGLCREVGDDVLLLHYVTFMEQRRRFARELMMRTERMNFSFVEIHDVCNLGSRAPRYTRRGCLAGSFFAKHVRIFETCFPEQVKLTIIVRAAMCFQVFWGLVCRLVPPQTISKLKVYGAHAQDFQEELCALVPKEILPRFLLEDSEEAIDVAEPRGGIIPEGRLEAIQAGSDSED